MGSAGSLRLSLVGSSVGKQDALVLVVSTEPVSCWSGLLGAGRMQCAALPLTLAGAGGSFAGTAAGMMALS